MKKIVLLLLIINFCTTRAQPPKAFYASFGGNGEDIGYSVKQTLDNQYIVCGSSMRDNQSALDMYLVKLDSMGNVIWQKFIGGIGNEVAKSVIQLPDSGYVLTGFTNSYGMGGYDVFTVRTDKNGTVIWQQTFGGSNWDFANDVVQASDNNLLVVGYTESFGAGKKDGFIIKYDLLGNLIWNKFIGGINDDELKAIIKTNDNFLATVGYNSTKDINGDMYFIKLDLNGDTLFTKFIGESGKDYANDIIQKANGQYVICGSKTFTNNQYSQSYMYSINSSGTFTWQNNYNSSNANEEIISLSNSLKVADYSAYLRNVPVPAFMTQGNIILARFGGWPVAVNSFGGYGEEVFYCVEGTKDGGFITVGKTTSYSDGASDVFIIKSDTNLLGYTSVTQIRKERELKNEITIYRLANNLYKVNKFGLFDQIDIKVFDLSGRKIFQKTSIESGIEIDFSEQSKGCYLIEAGIKDERPVFFKIINE